MSQNVEYFLTGQQGEAADTGEGGQVQVHPLQAAGELEDAVDPVPEASQAPEPGPHRAVAEHQPPLLWAGPGTENI